MKQFSKSICSLFLITVFSFPLFAQKIDGTYPAFEALYNATYDNLNKIEADYLPLFQSALNEANEIEDDYERTVRQAWANYIIAFTYASLEDLDNTEKYDDIAEELAKKAVDIQETEDSLLIYANTIGLNCTIKPMSYIISKGATVNPLAKKAIKLNPKNGRAVFLRESQYIYGPPIIANIKRGYQSMLDILADQTLETSPQLIFDINCAIAYALIDMGRPEEAKSYLQTAGRIFPNNISYVKTMSRLEQ